MNERERQIGKRLKKLRVLLGWSQAKFAKTAGITRDQLASVEYGRTPLSYAIALQIRKHFGFSALWLATERGDLLAHTPMPSLANIPGLESALFSEVFDTFLLSFFEQPGTAKAEMFSGLHDRALIAEQLDQTIEDWLFEIPDDSLEAFRQFIQDAAEKAGAECGSDSWTSILERKQRLQQYLEMRAFSGIGERKRNSFRIFAETSHLTEPETTDKTLDVKSPLANLRDRLNKQTAEPGKKSELAEYLGAPLASVSRWLSGNREPGGEIALKMLYWVERQERK